MASDAPSLRLLFAFLPKKYRLVLLLPAILSSIIAGGIAPFMTIVVGQTFAAFSDYPITSTPSDADKHRLLHNVSIAALQLVALAFAALTLSSITSSLWIATAERNVLALRKRVYAAVMSMDILWFESNRPLGPAGLMAKFTSQTDDIRTSSSLALGQLLQYLTTTLTCLALAFSRSPLLTLVILSSIPLLILIQITSQILANPLLASERNLTASAASLIQRALTALPTVKAFNAQPYEIASTRKVFNALYKTALKLNSIWALTSAGAQFTTLSMFVQGFWFGSKLVREGRADTGDVMAVFWACLIATSNLQMCIPQMIVVAKGKEAAADLVKVVNEAGSAGGSEGGMKKIRPESFRGEFSLVDVSFSYPARQSAAAASATSTSSSSTDDNEIPVPPTPTPTDDKYPDTPTTLVNSPSFPPAPASSSSTSFFPSLPSTSTSSTTPQPPHPPPTLQNISLFLPSHETTFIVGSSGSGKSTLAGLLLGLYRPTTTLQGQGVVCLDERDMRYLDPRWVAERVMCVGGSGGVGDVVFEGMTVAENLAAAVAAVGNYGETTVMDPTRGEIEDACRAAMLHEFVVGLPEGYDTVLSASSSFGSSSSSEGDEDNSNSSEGGGGGICLSGGQRQRLAIARARLRNPEVLILDEATSALDPPTRLLVFSALRTWRRNKTTIVITHDLAQVERGDFVYVLSAGRVVEQGFRGDLEDGVSVCGVDGGEGEKKHQRQLGGTGVFRRMWDAQMMMTMEEKASPPGYTTDLEEESDAEDDDDDYDDSDEDTKEEYEYEYQNEDRARRPQTYLRPLTFGNWMFDVIAELTAPAPPSAVASSSPATATTTTKRPRPLSIHVDIPEPAAFVNTANGKGAGLGLGHRRMSLQFTPTSPTFSPPYRSRTLLEDEEDRKFEGEKRMITKSGGVVVARRAVGGAGAGGRVRWESNEKQVGEVKKSHKKRWFSKKRGHDKRPVGAPQQSADTTDSSPPTFWSTVLKAWPTIPHKPLLLLGLLTCALSGAMTPLFSFLLSRLLFEVSTGAQNVSVINRFGGLVLGVAGLDGMLMGVKYLIMETCASGWVREVRGSVFEKVLGQDKAWFERSSASTSSDSSSSSATTTTTTTMMTTPVQILQTLIKDADDAQHLISTVFSQAIVVSTMLSVGLVWATVRGWELTLVGLGIAPVFAGVMAVQTVLVARCEMRNKRAREAVGRGYFDALANVRAARCVVAFSGVYQRRFDVAAERALKVGVRGGFVEGCTYGVASGLIYLAEALLFYVGAVLVVRGRYTYLQMVEVLNLVVFTVTIGSQLMAFTERIAKSVQATSDLQRLHELATSHTPSDSTGSLQPPLSSSTASISFSNVTFSYPSRPSLPVLRNINLTIHPGESVAIVGSSGSGKSTIASLLQRLYEPSSGSISLAGVPLPEISSTYLRDHVSVVSQHPHLFDASVAENIRYGSSEDKVSDVDVRRAAKEANAHVFVMGLPHGYDTLIGENATLVSGGQAQRLQIARALVRPCEVLVLDECTSALDPENQRTVMEAVRKVKEQGGRTTVMVTHKVQVMKMCDRIVLVDDGQVKEEGTFEALMRKKGLFASLASGGEWQGD